MFLSFFRKYLYAIFKTYIDFARNYILAKVRPQKELLEVHPWYDKIFEKILILGD